MIELKLCPFCGSTAHINELKTAAKPSPRYFVTCSNSKYGCIASYCDTFGRRFYTKTDAAEAWNRRIV